VRIEFSILLGGIRNSHFFAGIPPPGKVATGMTVPQIAIKIDYVCD